MYKAVHPSLVLILVSALFLKRSSTTPKFPSWHAKLNWKFHKFIKKNSS